MIQIRIPGDPVAKHRPRFARRGKFVETYNDQESDEGRAQAIIINAWGRAPMAGPVRLSMQFRFRRPKSHYGTGKNADRLKPSAPAYPVSERKDIDNIEKFYMDCMTGVVYADDRQVVDTACRKTYSDGPGETIIVVEDLLARP